MLGAGLVASFTTQELSKRLSVKLKSAIAVSIEPRIAILIFSNARLSL
jgi:hypothetical protein